MPPPVPPPATAPWPLRALDAAARRPRRLVLLAALLPFLQTLGNRPVLDDGWAVLDNPLVRAGPAALARIFAEPYGYAGGATLGGPYRPVTTLTHAVSYALHGRAPLGWHAVNVALHAAAALLVLLLARALARAAAPARSERIGLAAGLLFAVHPVHVEAIAPIVGRADLLAACGTLGALLLALRRDRRFGLPLAVPVLAAAVLSKESAAVGPLLLFIVAVAVPGAAGLEARPGLDRPERRRALARAAGLAAILSLALLPYLLARGLPRGVPPEARWFAGVAPEAVLWSATRVLAEYLRLLAFPAFLGTDFAYAARIPLLAAPDPSVVLATAAWGAVLAGGLLLLRRAPLVAAGILWSFAALLPVLHVLPIGVLMAERLLYLPSAGACLAAAAAFAAALDRPLPRPARAALPLLLAAAVGLLGVRAAVRAREWRTSRALWEAELPKAPRDPVVNNNLALEYTAAGEPGRAVPLLETALAAAPRYWRAHVNLGIARQELGDLAGARSALLAASRLAPREAAPLRFLARLEAARGELGAAAEVLARARRLAPEDAVLAREEGELLLALGRAGPARAALEEALRLDPRDAQALRLLRTLETR